MEVVVACNYSCEALWGGRTQLTPRIDEAFMAETGKPLASDWPTPPEAVRSLTLSAEPLWMQEIGKKPYFMPLVTEQQEKALCPADSLVLGVNCYSFAGVITKCDHYTLTSKNPRPEGDWAVNIVLDCGIPLLLRFNAYNRQSVPGFVPIKRVRGHETIGKDAEPGMCLAGVARLQHSPDTWLSGLHQPVLGIVRRMQLLGMEPLQEGFGQLHDVPYGTRSKLDPFLFSQDYAFMTLDIQDIGKMAYKKIPARDPACPEPELP